MSNKGTALDRTEEEILTYNVSDEALETAADAPRGGAYRLVSAPASTSARGRNHAAG
jgi:hypothetical protein